jgi:hypothetical protein
MKIKLAILALAGVFFWRGEVRADTITTGDLSFTCRGGCIAPTPITPSTFAASAPTAGSFTYDNTTNQFLNFTLTWDGITFGVDGLTETNYLALLSIGPNVQKWTGTCIAGLVNRWPQFSCDDAIDFTLFLLDGNTVTDVLDLATHPGVFVISPANPTTYPYDAADGTITATDLVTTTPEPPLLVLLGTGLLGLYKSASRRRHQSVRQSQ